MLQEFNVTPEQLTQFVEKQENFTPENWDQLQAQKKELDQKLDRELKNIKNPLKTKKSYKSKVIDNRWLYVK